MNHMILVLYLKRKMDKKEVLHLLKNSLSLKKKRYLYAAASFGMLIVIRSLYHVLFMSELIFIALNLLFAFIPVYFLFNSELISNKAKTGAKSSSETYSLSYLFPTIISFGSYIAAIIIEILIDSLVLTVPAVIFKMATYKVFFTFVFIFYLLYILRLTSLANVIRKFKGRYTQLYKTQHTPSSILLSSLAVIFGLLFVRWLDVVKLSDFFTFISLFVVLLAMLILIPRLSLTLLRSDKTYVRATHWKTIILVFLLDIGLFYLADPFNLIIPDNQKIFRYIDNGKIGEINKLLVVNKTIMTQRDHANNFTPLLYAVHSRHSEIAQLLIDSGASVFDVGKHNLNLLHLASQKCYPNLALQFVKKGLDINSFSDKHRNALFYAAKDRCYPLVIYYERLGVDPKILDVENMNFREYAKFGDSDTTFDESYDFLSEIGVFKKE
jgi:hypothetical protein